jgi:hypothetical protein
MAEDGSQRQTDANWVTRHARACPAYPRLFYRPNEDVDGRDKPGHDDEERAVPPRKIVICDSPAARGERTVIAETSLPVLRSVVMSASPGGFMAAPPSINVGSPGINAAATSP